MSPKRTRNHVLEDLSRLRFHDAMPKEWVVRNIEKDYGVDLEVEIFESGQATGMTFKVQVKATASLKNKHPRQRITMQHYRYWNELDVPVLIALYVQDDDNMYARWSITHDPGLEGTFQKSTTMTFSGEDTLNSKVERIADEVNYLRLIKRGALPESLNIVVQPDMSVERLHDVQLQFRRRIDSASLNDLLRVAVQSEQSSSFLLESNSESIRVAFPLNAGSITLHAFELGTDLPTDSTAVVDNAFLLLAALFSIRGRTHEAFRILSHAAKGAVAWYSPHVADALSQTLMSEHQPGIGLDIADKILDQPDDSLLPLALPYLAAGGLAPQQLDQRGVNRLLHQLERLRTRYLSLDDHQIVAALFCRSASVLTTLDRYAEALPHLRAALDRNAELASDPDFCTVYGAAAFRAGEHQLSALMYERSLRVRPDSLKTQAHLADALLLAGKYRESLEVVRGRHGPVLQDRLSTVNGIAAHEILRIVNVEEQECRDLTEREIAAVSEDSGLALSMLRDINALSIGLWLALDASPVTWSFERCVLLGRLRWDWGAAWVMATLQCFEQHGAESLVTRRIVESGLNDAPDYLDVLTSTLAESAAESDTAPSALFCPPGSCRTAPT